MRKTITLITASRALPRCIKHSFGAITRPAAEASLLARESGIANPGIPGVKLLRSGSGPITRAQLKYHHDSTSPRSVADIEGFVGLLRAACEDPQINGKSGSNPMLFT